MKTIILFLLLFILLISIYPQAVQNQELALELKEKAIELMDSGLISRSIEILNEAKLLDPNNYVYDYEIGFAQYLSNDLVSAIKTFKKVIKYNNANDQCYQMLGNLLDMHGSPKDALKTYDKGLKLFPNSGRLFLEKGTIYYNQKDYNEALNYYEKGIYNDPAYSSNYYRATGLYCYSSEEVWGMIYGEIFMNLERNSKRTSEISKLLYDTYKSQIQFISDTSFSVSFSKNNTININAKNLKKDPTSLLETFKIPYGVGVYEETLMRSIFGIDTITLESLNNIRTSFINNYFDKKYNEKYPVVLFDYNKKLIDLGFFEPYNYWILMKGNEEEFGKWQENNQKKWDKFVEWFIENPLTIDENNKFHSSQF